MNGLITLLPAAVAVVLALATRQVLIALFGGVWVGAALLSGSVLDAFPRSLDILSTVVVDADKAKIILFTLLMGGMVGVIGNSGGSAGVVRWLSRYAKTPKSGAVATWLMGAVVFFDDYASCLLLGNTMRPITDKLRISREKLSFIVDATAAPVTSIALVSTWVGYEISVLQEALAASGIERDAYEVFLLGLGSRFYPILMLFFVGLIAFTGRDFGPMWHAEQRARAGGGLLREGASPLVDAELIEGSPLTTAEPRALCAVLPILTMLGTVLAVLGVTGVTGANEAAEEFARMRDAGVLRALGFILGKAATYDALVYGSAAGLAAAASAALAVRALPLQKTMDAFVAGVRATILAVLVLVLAWSIGRVMSDLKTGANVAAMLGTSLPSFILPTATFLLAGALSFATGTSWGTMAILFPVAIPLVAAQGGTEGFEVLLFGVSSAVLAGAVFGDHCSPISDTTVLASIASAADHVDHTRTQIPYALTVGAVSILAGTLPMALGVPVAVCLVLGAAILIVVVRLVGRA